MKESFEQQPEKDPTILMQGELLKKHPDWIEAHAKDFRNFIDERPDVIQQYKENPEETIQELENKFYH